MTSQATSCQRDLDAQLQWGISIPMRDGVRLNGTLYLPRQVTAPAPTLLTMTPYVAQSCHDQGMYFAGNGYPFLAVDVRGRGNSEGTFAPLINEGLDAHDVIEWLADQDYCDGQVATLGGSYSGYVQWAAARERPRGLAAMVPTASPCVGVDFPGRSNFRSPYLMQWLTLVWGRTSQDKLFWGSASQWGRRFQRWSESGAPFAELDRHLGCPSAIFQEWISHPNVDAYWDSYGLSAEQYGTVDVPVLTVTGSYDGNQLGALAHYRQHLAENPRAQHHLVIGPWDHAGTRAPQTAFGGIEVGDESLIDVNDLHLQWYDWVLRGGAKPKFLEKPITYYVMGTDCWRQAETVEAITTQIKPLYLQAEGVPNDPFRSGVLSYEPIEGRGHASYKHDPRDVSLAALEASVDPDASLADQRMLHASAGKWLVYHSDPFETDIEVSGFFSLTAWIAIDRPDADFQASVYEIDLEGRAVLLSFDLLRARYRQSLREEKLITTRTPLRYDFNRFMFVSRCVRSGHRLRLVISPVHSIYYEKNGNTGAPVAAAPMEEAVPVTVTVHHNLSCPSVLQLPIGEPSSPSE